jgi:lipopolysaccharide biosynthesis protein
MVDTATRAVAFYLPQFHPIPENSEWWGPGFTEWTNATRARPLFRGHRQPHLPADLGFYDLRLAEARAAQSELALEYGVSAFCYWHYWFGGGSRILERPFAEVLASGHPDISFCLGWANQSWTGIWHAAENTVLREQTYPGPEDDQAHFDTILPAFKDPRYLRVGGKPVFYVFRPEELPSASEFVDRWQHMARAAGLEGLYLVAEVSDLLGAGPRYTAVAADGFDAGVYVRLPALKTPATTLRMRARRKLGGPEAYPYSSAPEQWDAVRADPMLQPSVYPNWDNTPRSGARGLVLTGSSPDKFGANLDTALSILDERPVEERLLWIKSWNEWAEGNYLEPDQEYGRAWLDTLCTRLAAHQRLAVAR